MKNWLLNTLRTAVILLSATLLTTSCLQSDFDEPLLAGETVMVSFNPTLDNNETTRVGKGRSVDILYAELYLNGERIGERHNYDVSNGTISGFSMELLKNQTYTIVFWAQNESCGAYDTSDLSNIKISYPENIAFSDIEKYDAFYAACTFTVDQATIKNGVDVKLTRPFALIIAGVNDIASRVNTSITVSKVATKFNALNYNASGEASPTFNFTPDGTILVPGKSHKMIGMAYVLPLKDTATTVTVRTVNGTQSEENTVSLNKLEANKKYNILSAQ